jgi:5-deoxy-glucuronate isomerase
VTLIHRRGSLAGPGDGDLVTLTAADAGWTWTGLRVLALPAGVERTITTGASEVFVLPLSGGVRVTRAGCASR